MDTTTHLEPDRKATRTARRKAAAVLAAALTVALGATGCGGGPSTTASASTTTTSTAAVARPTGEVDELVASVHGRLHLRCVGTGATTVLLIAGWDSGDGTWGAVEPEVARHARVCSYARFGTGSSDPAPSTQTFASQAADLHDLLDAADEPGPYVVLGHSFGGAVAATFTSRYADEVTGLVLLDASPATWPATVCSVPAYRSLCDVMHDPSKDPERLAVFRAFAELRRITSLGDVRLTVVTAAHRNGEGVSPAELARLDALWAEGQRRWADLSSSSKVVTVPDTGHHIELEQPARVVEEILELVP